MAGVYVHIPFCKKACTYCDFHFSTTFEAYREELILALLKEIVSRKAYLQGEVVETIYFGGGTPSLLTQDEITRIIAAIQANFICVPEMEVTLEANPDDIEQNMLTQWKAAGINRLSIGIQSFDDNDLKWMNRAHTSEESIRSIELAKQQGFLVTIDLIYGLPNVSNEEWTINLTKAVDLGPDHISAYCLTVEENTVLDLWTKKGKIARVPEEEQAEQFDVLLDYLENQGYEQYEISNFARNNKYAKHNTNYWRGKKYIGVGPSAHSYNGGKRAWNVSNNQLYIKAWKYGISCLEEEVLTQQDRFNELLMTGLRTKWGVDLVELERILPLESSFMTYMEKAVINEEMIRDRNQIILTKKGRLRADKIASDLFVV